MSIAKFARKSSCATSAGCVSVNTCEGKRKVEVGGDGGVDEHRRVETSV